MRFGQRDGDVVLLAGEDLVTRVIATVGNDLQAINPKRGLGKLGHPGQLIPVVAGLDNIMRDDQVMFGIDGGLDIVADDA